MEIGNIIPHIEAVIFASDKPLTTLEITDIINNAFGFMEDKIMLDQVESAMEGVLENLAEAPFNGRADLPKLAAATELTDEERSLFWPSLAFNLTIAGRGTYLIQQPGVAEPTQLRAFNEIQHCVLARVITIHDPSNGPIPTMI